MSVARIIAFIGASELQSAQYEYDGRCHHETGPAMLALAANWSADGEASSTVYVLGTLDAQKTWNDTRQLPDLRRRLEGLNAGLVLKPIPRGETTEELWKIFDTVAKLLSPGELKGESGFPSEILVDITHGYRAQGIIASAAVSFQQSEWQRQGLSARDTPVVRLLYGALDPAKDQCIHPIWDLSPFLSAASWNSALNGLIRYGRADELAVLAGDEAQAMRGGDGAAAFEKLGKLTKLYADDLTLIRLKDLLTMSAMKLREFLASDEVIERLAARIAPLRGALATLRGQLDALQVPVDKLLDLEGLRATAALVVHYGQLERFAEQSVVIREAMVTWLAHAKGAEQVEPGMDECKANREQHDKFYAGCASAVTNFSEAPERITPEWLRKTEPFKALTDDEREAMGPALRFIHATKDARNDIQHAGIRSKPAQSEALRGTLKRVAERFARLIYPDRST